MGYYTEFELIIQSGNDCETDYNEEISSLAGYQYLFDDTVKWYDCEKDMKTYSKQHPDTVFMLSGKGEENGDLWKAYFKNGKMQKCDAVITYNDFNEDLLK